jgi:hypothetical protein
MKEKTQVLRLSTAKSGAGGTIWAFGERDAARGTSLIASSPGAMTTPSFV